KTPGGRAHQQPRRAVPEGRGHLSQALAGQPVRRGRAADRAAALGVSHLSPAAPLAVRVPKRADRRPRPRRPRFIPRLTGGTERLLEPVTVQSSPRAGCGEATGELT